MSLIGSKSFKWGKVKPFWSYYQFGILPPTSPCKHKTMWQVDLVLGMNVRCKVSQENFQVVSWLSLKDNNTSRRKNYVVEKPIWSLSYQSHLPNEMLDSVHRLLKQPHLYPGDEIIQPHSDPATPHRSGGAGLSVVLR